jgi:hypothetical protein
MRVLITKESKKRLLIILKKKYDCKNIKKLAEKLNVNKKTLEGWFFLNNRYLPSELLVSECKDIEIIDEKEEGWGQSNGGRKGYQTILRKYGIKNVKKIQALGGKNAAKTKDRLTNNFKVDIENPTFLEIYGVLLGDGWLSNQNNPNNRWAIGICGNLKLDKEFVKHCRKSIESLTKRRGYLRERETGNVIEFRFRHKRFFKFLNEELKFPEGKKENLEIPKQIYSLGYDKVCHVIRGIFDTDGSFYLDKNRHGLAVYPCISVHMKEPILINQIGKILKDQGFKLSYSDNMYQIKLKGRIQLNKWIKEIGSSNPYKLMAMKKALK